uniref:Major facilitator superfamily (MFS) profile domain-containing protein n=1 Tax=Acrobeloides nanus TaxID=290746 RepID=A0A914EEI2_9BILA
MSQNARKLLIKNASLTVAKEAEELIQQTYGHQWISNEPTLHDESPSTSKSCPDLFTRQESPSLHAAANFLTPNGELLHADETTHFPIQFHELFNALNHGHGILNENSNSCFSESGNPDFPLHPNEWSFLGLDRISIRTSSNCGDTPGSSSEFEQKFQTRSDNGIDADEANKLVCSECGFFANNRKQLWRHGKREKHQIRETLVRKEIRSTIVHRCQSCNFTTSSSFNLMRHIQRIHINVKSFICPNCAKSFKDNDTLQTHIKYIHEFSLINPLADVLQTFLEESFNSTHGVTFDSWALRIIWPSVAGQLFTGALMGSMLAPKLINFLGLKRSILLSSFVLSTSFFISFLSKWLVSSELFILGRFFSGTGIGMSTTMQTVYLTEISPINYRGTMGTLTGFANSVGFVFASAIGLPQVFGQYHLWQWTYVMEMIPTIVLILAMGFLLHESPVFLLKNAKEKEAIKCLEWYYPKPLAAKRLAELVKETNSATEDGPITMKQLLVAKLALYMGSEKGVNLMSITECYCYETGAAAANCLASFSGIFGNVVGSFMIDKIGRRKLLIGGLLSLSILNSLLMILVFYFKLTHDVRSGYAFLLIFMLFLFVFSLGVGPMAWFIATELSDANYRPWIQSFSTSCQYLTCFLSPLIFFPCYQLIGALSFLLFIFPLTMCSLYLYLYLPETKNCAIEEIIHKLNQ